MSPTLRCLSRLAIAGVLSTGCGEVAPSTSHGSRDARPAVDVRASDVAVDSRARGGRDASSDAGHLQWYFTCGYPVCGEPGGDAGEGDAGEPDAGICPDAGSACTPKGATCGVQTNANCGVILECDDTSPAVECPESSRNVKDAVRYADDATLKRLHDEAIGIRLATYRYKPTVADPTVPHLGFLIEDNPESQAVQGGRGRVDMYGYVSMVVASMQVQEKEIAELRRELEAVRKDAAACRGGKK